MVPTILNENFGNRKHMVFVDDFVSDIHHHTTVSMSCHTWVNEKRCNRWLFTLCSMATRGLNTLDEDTENHVRTHTVYSGCLSEFVKYLIK